MIDIMSSTSDVNRGNIGIDPILSPDSAVWRLCKLKEFSQTNE